MFKFNYCLCAVMVLLVTQLDISTAGAWGAAHKRIGEAAVQNLPAGMRPFFEANLGSVGNAVQQEPPPPPQHYIGMERYPDWPNTPIVRDYDAAVAAYGEAFVTAGDELAPWAVADYAEMLSNEMSSATTYQDWQVLISTAGVLGHYITDLHQPFHLTTNLQGNATGNNGVHGRYEATFVDTFQSQLNFTPVAAQYQSSVIDTIFDTIEGTGGPGTGNFQYVDQILAADDIATAIDPTFSITYYNSMWDNTGGLTQTLFQDASETLANVWYTAWVDAGSPVIPSAPVPKPLITGVSIEDVSSEFGSRVATQTIDYSGLAGTGAGTVFGSGEHDRDTNTAMWQTTITDGPTGVITYDLGDNYDLDEIHVWNFNASSGDNDRSARDVTILVSSDDDVANLVSLGNFTFDQASGEPADRGFSIDLSSFALADNARLVRFDITSNYGDPDFVGLSEVQFSGTAIPEPSSLLLVGLGMVSLLGYGRRVIRKVA